MDKTADIIFFVVAITVLIVLLTVLIINLLLIGRNRRLKHQNELLQVSADFQHELMKAQIELVENTLNDISKELHDDVGQMITLSIIQLNNIDSNDFSLNTKLAEVRNSVQASLNSVRDISKVLSTDYLKTFGIREALDKMIHQVNKATGINFNLSFDSGVVFKAAANEIITFRILQELITNTIKHAEASTISIVIRNENENMLIDYKDNGKGLTINNANELNTKKGLGFTNLHKRVALMKGTISTPDLPEGFGIKLIFPN